MIKNESSNITLNAFERVNSHVSKTNAMSMEGTLNKTLILLLLVFVSGYFAWTNAVNLPIMPLLIGSVVVSFIIAIVLAFKPMFAKYLAPVYTVVQGAFLGAISFFFETVYPGIVIQAVLITFVIAFLMNVLYRNKIIKVTEKFRSIMLLCIFGVMGVYLVSMILNMFGSGIPYIHGSGPVGIIFSVVVLIIASLTLLLDFDFIERHAGKVHKDMEWYGAFSLIVSLLWIYIEVLKLLAKLRSND